jgi:REP element-mobilizing transposase RayT
MASTLTNLLYHVVFSTKGRLGLIRDDIEKKLRAYMGGIVRTHGGIALGIGGTNNHVHMMIKLKPAMPLANIIRFIKSGSSKWMNELPTTTERFYWQTGYGAFSVSESQASRVLNYIRDQKLHHREQSFEEELVILLAKHSVSYDAKYIWD